MRAMSLHPARGPLMWARVTAAAGCARAATSPPPACRPPEPGWGASSGPPAPVGVPCPAVSGTETGVRAPGLACTPGACPAGVGGPAGAAGASSRAFPSAEDTSPSREGPGREGSSGGQEDPAGEQWGEQGARRRPRVWGGGPPAAPLTASLLPAARPRFTQPSKMRRRVIARPVGSSVRLKCVASGHPRPDITWMKDDQALVRPEPGERRRKTWTLSLKNLRPEDSGKYTCRVSNRAGAINATYKVDVIRECRAGGGGWRAPGPRPHAVSPQSGRAPSPCSRARTP